MELRLVVQPDGRRDRIRQVGLGRHLDVQAGLARRRRFALDLLAPRLRLHVHEVARALEVAVDRELVDERRDPLDRRLVRLAYRRATSTPNESTSRP